MGRRNSIRLGYAATRGGLVEHTCGKNADDFPLPTDRFYRDLLHGFRAKAKSKTMAWMLIRNKCHENNLPVPTMHEITEEEV